MTPFEGVQHLLSLKMLVLACKYMTLSKYAIKTETEQKKRLKCAKSKWL